MFRHCIAGIDFSAGWDQARAQLTRMVPLLGIRQLTLLHADEPHHRSRKEANTSANRRTHLEQLAKDMAESLTIPTEPVFVSGFATSSLLEFASRREAGLILVANSSHSRGQDFIMGNVALDLARQSRLPLLIIPVDLGPIDDAAPLLLVTDHSQDSTRARTCFTALLGSERNGRVMIINSPDHQLDFEELKAEEGFAANNERLDIGVALGDPVDEVCNTASELKTPLIVIGKHGSPPLGGVAEGICRRALNPLLLIPS